MEIIGIHKDGSKIEVASLSQTGGEISIDLLEAHRDQFFSKKNPFIVTGVDGQDLLIRRLRTPLKKKRALNKTLPFQLEALIPYQLEDVVVKPIYIPMESETEALFFTVSKKNLEKHLESFEEEGLSPQWVSAVPMALSRFASLTCPDISNLVVFHMGATKTQIVSLQEGIIRSHLTLHMGADDLGKGKKGSVKLKREVDRAFCFLSHKEEGCQQRHVLFCGERAEEVEALLTSEEEIVSVQGTGKGEYTWDMVRPFAISIGLSLDVLKNDSMSIQLRQGEYVSERCLKSIQRKLFFGIGVAAALFLFTALSSHLSFSKKEKAYKMHVTALIDRYKEDFPQLALIDKEVRLSKMMVDVRQELEGKKKKENVYLEPPRVADLLAFLSTHPQLEDIEVTKVSYELKQYPSLDRPKEIYVPRVRVAFTAHEAKRARDFHDAIVEDTDFVDGTKEIEWKRNEDRYEIAFYVQA